MMHFLSWEQMGDGDGNSLLIFISWSHNFKNMTGFSLLGLDDSVVKMIVKKIESPATELNPADKSFLSFHGYW